MERNITSKAFTMIDPVTGYFEITQYNNKRAISIAKLAENMCMSRYPRSMEITYNQVSECIGQEFRKPLTEKE